MTDWKKDFEKETRFNLIKDNSVYRFKNETSYEEYDRKCRKANLKPFSEPNWESIRELLQDWGYIGLQECSKEEAKIVDEIFS